MSDITDALDKAEANIAAQDTVEASVEALLTAIQGQVTDLKNQLANAGVDPALVARVGALADHIAANNGKMQAAVTANTPAAPSA